MEKEIQERIKELCIKWLMREPERMELLPASGSARRYYRLFMSGKTYMATWNADVRENRLFLDFSAHFRKKGLHVPEIYAVAADGQVYVQEDLGDRMLLDAVEEGRTADGRLTPEVMALYRKALAELQRFQLTGHDGMDYSGCVPRPVFDRRCILWDLNYFKYCFLRLAGAAFSEEALENDFERLAERLCGVDNEAFMFRDFQSRNIMVRDGEVWFIDYQGGRQGALQYDVASLLYDAIVGMPGDQREELLNAYIDGLEACRGVDRAAFRRDYYHFVLVRLLQAMGAFGLRGLYEKKPHFIDSIRPGLQHIDDLFRSGRLGEEYPEIRRVCGQLAARFTESFTAGGAPL